MPVAATWAALHARVDLTDVQAVCDVVAQADIELRGQSVWVNGRDVTEQLLGLKGIEAVYYDITHKPPGTVEWESC